MFVLLRTQDFAKWLDSLKDQSARAQILVRINRASFGNFGDCKPVGAGVSEMRIDHGPGYRIYFVKNGATIYVLLHGGSKKSQARDIATAKRIAKELKEIER